MRARGLVWNILLIASLLVFGPELGALGTWGPATAHAGEVEAAPASKSKSKAKTSKARASKSSKGKSAKKKRRRQTGFKGHGVSTASLRTEPVPRPSGEVWLYSANFREEVRVNIYDENGELSEEALAQLDSIFRCRRSGEVRAVDPRLYETLSVIFDHFGSQRIELVSGFRYQRNEGSRHYHASAMDIRISGVSTRRLYKFAESLDTGGMGIGIYPNSGFVHVDWRAPGEPSYRWTDYSGPGESPKKKKTRKKRPTS